VHLKRKGLSSLAYPARTQDPQADHPYTQEHSIFSGSRTPIYSAFAVLVEILWRDIAPKQVAGFCWQDLMFAGDRIFVSHGWVFLPWLILIFGVAAGSFFSGGGRRTHGAATVCRCSCMRWRMLE
jgi:hypothetical protein